jgi:hypothetical protein
MNLRYRVEIRGVLPTGLQAELRHRFGDFGLRTRTDRTVLSDVTVDQAGLRALLEQLWDSGGDLRLVTTMNDGTTMDDAPEEHR